MIAPKLLIRKRMLMIQNRVRPCCFVQAVVNPAIQSVLEQHFLGEALFRRVSYSSNWPEAAVKVPPSLGPALSALLKNDACPEISVKSILAGQMHQAANAWEMMSFELIAKVAFNNLVQLIATVVELDRDIYYTGQAPASLEPDTPATTPGSEIATADASTLAA